MTRSCVPCGRAAGNQAAPPVFPPGAPSTGSCGHQGARVACQRRQPGDRPEVLLAVAAAQHLLAEQLVEGLAGGQHRHLTVVEPVREDDQAQRRGLVGHRLDVGEADRLDAVAHRAVAAGVHLGQMLQQGGEVVERGAGRAVRRAGDGLVVVRGGRVGQTAVAVVLTVDPQWTELGAQALDLAQEVGGGEAALAELAGQRVGGGGQRHTGIHQLAEQGGDQDGVAGVVQFELVDAQQLVLAEGAYGLLEAERAHEVRQLDEGAEGLLLCRGGGGVPQGGEQMGLADAVAAVQIDTARALRGGRLLGEPASLAR